MTWQNWLRTLLEKIGMEMAICLEQTQLTDNLIISPPPHISTSEFLQYQVKAEGKAGHIASWPFNMLHAITNGGNQISRTIRGNEIDFRHLKEIEKKGKIEKHVFSKSLLKQHDGSGPSETDPCLFLNPNYPRWFRTLK